MKSILAMFLILLIVGLYFFTEPTKGLIRITGKAVVKISKGIFNEIRNSNEYKELNQDIGNKTKEKLSELKGD